MPMRIEIGITGPRAVGKTHFARRLEEWLKGQDLPTGTEVVCTSSNFGSRFADEEFSFIREGTVR